jgi:hypothetical protein
MDAEMISVRKKRVRTSGDNDALCPGCLLCENGADDGQCRVSMARIKYVLNERRLGMMAGELPQINREDNHPILQHTPFWADPFRSGQALINENVTLPQHMVDPEAWERKKGPLRAVRIQETQILQEEFRGANDLYEDEESPEVRGNVA